MKKTLFSAAFIAASGVYVAAANHLLPFLPTDDVTLSQSAVSPAALSAATPAALATPLLSSSAPSASVTQLLASSAPADSATAESAPAPTIAEIAPVLPALVPIAPSSSQPQTIATAVTAPPLPRPRPAALAASVRPAAAATVATTSGYRDGTYTGSSENAYYGRVQVQAVVANHHITTVKVLSYPSDRRTSRYINSQALPLLQQEVIAANSANVDTVSGATLTSNAYIQSLTTALRQAGGTGA